MLDGLVFIWVEKEIISKIIQVFENLGFFYVENVAWVMLDESKKQGKILFTYLNMLEVDDAKTTNVSGAYIREDYCYLKKSHKTMLMFRRL